LLFQSGHQRNIQVAAARPQALSLIEEITQLSAMQELFAWFRAGYIPISAKPFPIKCLPNASVWAKPTSEVGFEYFWIETEVSRAILRGEQFNFSKLPPAKNSASKSIADWFSLIEEITQLSAMQELFAWFRAGYIPVSMAAPLGAKECAATFNSIQHPIAWIDLESPVVGSVVETKFGYSCHTGGSYMLRVKHRGDMKEPASWYRGVADDYDSLCLLRRTVLI
jgi:hypothetical protein